MARAILALAVLTLLVLQPDAAAAAAFGGATLFLSIFTGKDARRFWFAFMAVAFMVAAIRRPDPLGRVSYVEDIVVLASRHGLLWTVAALVSLALLPLPFLLLWRTPEGPLGFALALYFVATLLASFFGNFPVPLLGYGASSYIGYFTAVAWVSGRLKRSIPA